MINTDQNLKELLTETQKLITANNELEAAIKKLQQAQEKMASGNDKLSKTYRDNASELRKAESAIKSNTEQIEKNIKTLDAVKGAVEKNTAAFDKLEANLAQNTKAQKDNTESVGKLNQSYTSLGKAINDSGKSVKDSGKDFEYGEKFYENIQSSLDDLKESAGDFGPQLEQVSKGFNALKTGSELVEDGFKGIGSAIKATGFGLFMIVLEAITEYFSKDKIGIKRFQGGLAAIGVIVDKVKLVVQKLGGAIIDALIHPVDNIKKFWDGLVAKFSTSFSALGEIITGVFTLSPEKISHGVKQLSGEVNKATNTIKNGFNALKKEVVNTITEAGEAYDKAYKNAGKAKSNTTSTRKRKSRSPKPDTSHGEQLMAAKAQTLIDTIQADKKAYEQEMALLDNQLNKKLISQAEYNKKSRELQEQYHQAIGTVTEEFRKKEMQATVERSKQVAEEDSRKKGIAYDEKEVKKAVLPGKQFEAEKKLIEDKFALEIFQAQGNEEKIKEIKAKSQQAQTELAQKYEQQRKEFALNAAQQVADKAFSIIGNNIKASSEAKIKGLEKDKAGELSNKNLTQTQRKAIEDKYKKKEDQEKLKAFKAEQKMSVLQAVVNGALAVTKATSQTGVLAPFVIPAIVASTALQVATIVAQKPPAFAQGGQFVSDGRGALLPGYSRTDNTNAYLRSGEAVVVSEAMRNPWARNLVSAINVAHGGRDFSMPNTGRGYAIGGIFTDGGNANRYYNQPVNDIKDMANTLAYQMINNFPPIYVDVKDVNNQQNILAQTVNRVNL